MAVLTVQDCSLAGVVPTYNTASGGGDTFVDNGKQETFIEVVNGGGSSINVTITAVDTTKTIADVGPITVADKVIAVANGARKVIGPFPKAYRSAQSVVSIAYSAVTSVTLAVVRVAKIDG